MDGVLFDARNGYGETVDCMNVFVSSFFFPVYLFVLGSLFVCCFSSFFHLLLVPLAFFVSLSF